MSDYHTIRLHGPWQADFFSPEADEQSGNRLAISQQRIRLPIDEETAALTGPDAALEIASQIELSRHFNWPHGQDDSVFLNVDSNIDWQIKLNGQAITQVSLAADQAESISSFLTSRNRLQLSAKLPPRQQVRISEISLKIVPPSR